MVSAETDYQRAFLVEYIRAIENLSISTGCLPRCWQNWRMKQFAFYECQKSLDEFGIKSSLLHDSEKWKPIASNPITIGFESPATVTNRNQKQLDSGWIEIQSQFRNSIEAPRKTFGLGVIWNCQTHVSRLQNWLIKRFSRKQLQTRAERLIRNANPKIEQAHTIWCKKKRSFYFKKKILRTHIKI